MSRFWKSLVWTTVAGSVFLVFGNFLPALQEVTYNVESYQEATSSKVFIEEKPQVVHIETPDAVKALYMTACVAGTPSWRAGLKQLIEETELNAVVIDIKDFTGKVSFPNNFPKSPDARGCVVPDMKEFIEELHRSEIYVIGRVSVFQDASYTKLFPELAVKKKNDGGVWKDYKGLSFIDVGAEAYWDYIVGISEQAYEIGFDELNYDYVRYPSDGPMSDALYTHTSTTTTKELQLEAFFSYLYEKLKTYRLENLKTSVDLFGMTTTVENGMGIGQLLEKALPYFDYVSPMVYPSHYPKTWHGFPNPAEHPYEVISIAMRRGMEREKEWNIRSGNFSVDELGATTTPASKLRPWLQDFNLGAQYTPDKVRAQIQATYDVGLTSWMLWDAANTYTREALLSE